MNGYKVWWTLALIAMVFLVAGYCYFVYLYKDHLEKAIDTLEISRGFINDTRRVYWPRLFHLAMQIVVLGIWLHS